MTWTTHMAGGALLGAVAAGLVSGKSLGETTLTIAVASIAALLPDLDVPRSKISKLGNNHSLAQRLLKLSRLVLAPLSRLINKCFGHRGFWHSPHLWLPLTAVLWLIGAPIWVTAGFGAGVLSHLILDTFNSAGIPWLFPWRKRFSLASVPLHSVGEGIVRVACIAGTIGVFFLFDIV